MSCACSSSSACPAPPAYGPVFYWPAGSSAAFRFPIKSTPTGVALSIDPAGLTLYLKKSETVADADASLTATVANEKLEVIDAELGLIRWKLAPGDTSPAAYTPGSPWFRYLKYNDGTNTYVIAGSAGPCVLDATAPAVGITGHLVAYAPYTSPSAEGPDSSPESPYVTQAELDETVDALFTRASAANSDATATTLALPAGSRRHAVDLVFTGAAGTRTIVAATTGLVAGDALVIDYTLPATAGLVIELRNATADGTLLDTLTTDATGDSACINLTFSGTVWQLNHALYPSD